MLGLCAIGGLSCSSFAECRNSVAAVHLLLQDKSHVTLTFEEDNTSGRDISVDDRGPHRAVAADNQGTAAEAAIKAIAHRFQPGAIVVATEWYGRA